MASAEGRLTTDQLQTLRQKLEDERTRILRVLEAATATVPSEEERSEFEETAQRTTEETHQIEIAERERALLAEVERALAKFRAGTYGVDEKTGDAIPYERLAAVPWARDGADE